MNNAVQKPDIEFKIKRRGYWHSYGHVYFHPLKIFLFGKKVWGYKNITGFEQKVKLEMLKQIYKEVIGNGSHTQGSILHYLSTEISRITGVNLPKSK